MYIENVQSVGIMAFYLIGRRFESTHRRPAFPLGSRQLVGNCYLKMMYSVVLLKKVKDLKKLSTRRMPCQNYGSNLG